MARPLKVFMRGKSIATLQDILRRMGYDIQDIKGLFGTTTRDAVKSYQKQQGLKPSGIVDEALMQMMQGGGAALPEVDSAVVKVKHPINPQALDALVRLLVKKGVFSQEEWEYEKGKAVPSSLT